MLCGSLASCPAAAAARLAAERAMDWYAWLCKAGLHPDVALDYALLFARNELVADDVRHFDHQFLTSMGVAVAKHRLEILKLARRESSSSTPRPAEHQEQSPPTNPAAPDLPNKIGVSDKSSYSSKQK
jgi:hypothetical protein